MADAASTSRPPRRLLRPVFLVLATLVTFLAVFTVWIARQALETDQWTQTSTKLLEQASIRTAVADFLTDELYDNVDVSAELRAALPPRAQPLAGPAAGALRTATNDVAKKALATAPVQQAWQNANRTAHELLVQIIEGGGDVVATNSGVVTLDLKALLEELERRTGIGGRAAGLLPADAATIEILRSDQLDTVQSVGKALKPLAAVFIILAVALFGAAIAISSGRRRETLRAAGFGFIIAGIAALAARRLLGAQVVDALAANDAVRPAVEDTWTIGTSLLVDVALATILYGAVTVAGAWFAGPTRAAVAVRARVAPHLAQPRIAYGGLAMVVLLLLWWGPTEATQRVLPMLLLTGLLAVGVEALRRQAVRETQVAENPPANGEVLLKLDELHDLGGIDDEQYEAARQRATPPAGSG